jgi:hypothetical protein
VKAAKEGKGGIGFPVGQIVADRYNLSKAVDAIEWNTYLQSGKKYKTSVFRNFGDKGNRSRFRPRDRDDHGNIQVTLIQLPTGRKNIADVVGKGVAEETHGKSGLLTKKV